MSDTSKIPTDQLFINQLKNMYDKSDYQMFNIKDGSPMTYSKWAQITDLMRLEIVYTYGGYYFDVN